MRRLSEIVKQATIVRSPAGVPDILIFDYLGKRYYRHVLYKYFSNYPEVTIMFLKEKYLVDTSCVEIEHVEIAR